MSHEIRTPMNAIIGMLELVLHRRDVRGRSAEQVQVAHDVALSLLELLAGFWIFPALNRARRACTSCPAP
ncbi:histidine kinase dimerization/phospho-acceptor domain-containing protein [Pseudomonas fluorescens]|nr:histidine kinase dimerization/phospho-acceptor domain-containing protein [Pseudomonas fluorescens]